PLLSNDYVRDAAPTVGSPFADIRTALAVPMRWDGELRGVMWAGWTRNRVVLDEDAHLLESFAELAAVACRNASVHADLAEAARTDALTGCMNHAALHETLRREMQRSRRTGRALTVALVDLDHFKQVNEQQGHLAGDEVLRRVGLALRQAVRPYDFVARYGGDEFALGQGPGRDEEPPPAPPPVEPLPGRQALDGEPLRRRNRQLTLSNALGARLAEMTAVQEIVDATVDELHRAFGYYTCAVLREEGDSIAALAGRGVSYERLPGPWSQPLGSGIIGRSLRERRTLVVNEVGRDADYLVAETTLGVRSELVAPIWVGSELWGALDVQEQSVDAFDEADARLIETVADQLGAALRSATLYEQLERAYIGTAEALATALEAKDAHTASHARAMVDNAEAVGRLLGLDGRALRDLTYGAAFHDIGKIAVPESILNKPGPLTREERAQVERH